MTLRQAYSVLIQKGCLEAQRSVGTFVLGSRVEKKVSGMLSFSEEVKASGGNPSSRLLSLGVRRPSPDAAAFLKLGPKECTFEIKRLRYANQRPLAIEIVQLPHDRFPGIDNFNWETESLYSVIEGQYGVKLSRCQSEIVAVPADREQARLLNVKIANPLLAINRKSYSTDNIPLEFCVTYSRQSVRRDLCSRPNPLEGIVAVVVAPSNSQECLQHLPFGVSRDTCRW